MTDTGRSATMLTEAIDYYHSLFNDDVARENDAALSAAVRREGLFFGTRPICIVLRPRLLGEEHYAKLQDVCGRVARAARQAVKFMLSDPPTRDLMAFTSGEEALLALDAGYAEPSASSRLDSFFDNHTGSLQFVEYNAESPAGMGYEDELSGVFLSLPVMQEFGRKYRVTRIPAAPPMVHTLLEKFREWGKSNDPRAAIVIAVMVLLSVSLGFIQEHRSNKAADALRRMVLTNATVRRKGAGAAQDHVDVLLAPGHSPESPLLASMIASKDIDSLNKLASSALLDLTVSTDNRPFFFTQLRFSSIPRVLKHVAGGGTFGGVGGGFSGGGGSFGGGGASGSW